MLWRMPLSSSARPGATGRYLCVQRGERTAPATDATLDGKSLFHKVSATWPADKEKARFHQKAGPCNSACGVASRSLFFFVLAFVSLFRFLVRSFFDGRVFGFIDFFLYDFDLFRLDYFHRVIVGD